MMFNVYGNSDGDRPSELRIRFKFTSGFVTGIAQYFCPLFISVLDYSKYYYAPAVVLVPLIGRAASTCLESPAL
jgi:hypothetical protein